MFAWRDQYLSYNGASTGDPYWTSVVFLQNYENYLAARDISTTYATNNPMTYNGGTTPTHTLFSPFSTNPSGSFKFSNGWLQTTGNIDVNSDFTVEAWVYLTSLSQQAGICGIFGDGVGGFYWDVDTNGQVRVSSGFADYVFPDTVSLNTWTSLATVKSSGTLYLYKNGTQSGTTFNVSGQNWTISRPLTIGRLSPVEARYLSGYISNVRVTKSAVYTTSYTPSTQPLTALANTNFLSTFSYQSYYAIQAPTDKSSNCFTVTVTGGTIANTGLSPFAVNQTTNTAYPGSLFGFSSGIYCSVATNAAFTYGTGDFTMECFVYFNSVGVTQYIIDQRNSGTATAIIPTIYVNASNKVIYYTNGAIRITGTQTITSGTWYHIAVCRSGTNTILFVNGTQDGSTYTDTNNYAASRVVIGQEGDTTGGALQGNISNIRLTKGFAYYTSTFTPSTTPLTCSTTISQTSLLITGENSGFYDLSNQSQYITQTSPGLTGYPNLVANNYKYGSQSIYFASAQGYLTVADATSLQFGTGDFTIEGWIYLTTTSTTQYIMGKGATTPTGWALYVNTSNNLVWLNGSTALRTSSSIIANSTWTYFAITRSGTTGYMFINGVLQSPSYTDSGNYNQTNNLFIGCDRSNTNLFNGYMDELRITKGVCRYTSNFASPSTGFLTYGSTTASSLYMPKIASGTNARIYTSSPSTALVQWYATSWTIEYWIYVPNMANLPSYNIDSQYSGIGNHDGAGTYYWETYVLSDGTVGMYAFSAGNISSAAGTITAGAWYSVAVVNTKGASNAMALYVNGTSVATASWGNGGSSTGVAFSIGPVVVNNAASGTYYIDELRESNIARYSGNYTPATSPFTSDANTLLLMHFNGVEGSTTFTDSGPSSFVFTSTSSTPAATISIAQGKF